MVAEAFGSYLENISWDEKGAPLWSINDQSLLTKWTCMTDEPDSLPSDSGKRADLNLIKSKSWHEAEDAKHKLEELQRHDKKQREARSKSIA